MMIVKKITNCYSDMHFRMVQHNVFFRSQKCLSHKQIGLLSGINNINLKFHFLWVSHPLHVVVLPQECLSVKILDTLQLLFLYLLPLWNQKKNL